MKTGTAVTTVASVLARDQPPPTGYTYATPQKTAAAKASPSNTNLLNTMKPISKHSSHGHRKQVSYY